MKKTPIGVFFIQGYFTENSAKNPAGIFSARCAAVTNTPSARRRNAEFESQNAVTSSGTFFGALLSYAFGFSPGIERKKPARVFYVLRSKTRVRVAKYGSFILCSRRDFFGSPRSSAFASFSSKEFPLHSPEICAIINQPIITRSIDF